MQLLRMVLIALLAGLFTVVLVWVLWDLPARLRATLMRRVEAWKRRREANALMDQTNEPEDKERPA
mgnify:CR=1 FL=1